MEAVKILQLNEATHASLKRLAKDHGRSMKQLVAEMVNYFRQSGIDPEQVNAGSSANAIKSLERRFTTFMRSQEKEKLAPMLDELAIVSKLLREKAETMLELEAFNQGLERLIANQKILNDNQVKAAGKQELAKLKNAQDQGMQNVMNELARIKAVISEKMGKKNVFN